MGPPQHQALPPPPPQSAGAAAARLGEADDWQGWLLPRVAGAVRGCLLLLAVKMSAAALQSSCIHCPPHRSGRRPAHPRAPAGRAAEATTAPAPPLAVAALAGGSLLRLWPQTRLLHGGDHDCRCLRLVCRLAAAPVWGRRVGWCCRPRTAPGSPAPRTRPAHRPALRLRQRQNDGHALGRQQATSGMHKPRRLDLP